MRALLLVFLSLGCDAPVEPSDDAGSADAGATDSGGPCTAAECEQRASDRYDGLLGKPSELAAFLKAMPKGGDLHQHLSGAVWAETYLDWGGMDGDCINSTTFAAVFANQCSATNQAIPTSGTFYNNIIKAWSM